MKCFFAGLYETKQSQSANLATTTKSFFDDDEVIMKVVKLQHCS